MSWPTLLSPGGWVVSLPPNYRRCISCRSTGAKDRFLRVVRLHPTYTVQLDQGMGRSAYLCPQTECLKLAQRKNRLGRALKATIPEDIYRQLWQRLEPELKKSHLEGESDK